MLNLIELNYKVVTKFLKQWTNKIWAVDDANALITI